MHDLIARMVAAGGTLYKRDRSWGREGISLTRAEVAKLFGAGLVERNGVSVQLTDSARALYGCGAFAGHAPAVGVELTYWKWGHAERGRVLSARPLDAVVLAQGARPGHGRPSPSVGVVPEYPLHVLHRPSLHAPWKLATSAPIGAFRPGGWRHEAALWSRLIAEGIVPPAVLAPPVGQPCTLARLTDVAARMRAIGAEPVSTEERAAEVLFPVYGPPGPRLDTIRENLRRKASQHHPDVLAYLDTFVANHRADIFVAEVRAAMGKVRAFLDEEGRIAIRTQHFSPRERAMVQEQRALTAGVPLRHLRFAAGYSAKTSDMDEVLLAAYHIETARRANRQAEIRSPDEPAR